MANGDFGDLLYDSTPSQRRATLAVAAGGVVLASLCAGLAEVDWAEWQWGVVLFVAFDLVGGVMAMSLRPAIRKLRPPDDPLRPVLFAAFHIHPLLLALLLPDAEWLVMCAIYASVLAGVLLIAAMPEDYRPGTALAWCAFALAAIALLGFPAGLEWLAPAYLLKLVGTQAVREPVSL